MRALAYLLLLTTACASVPAPPPSTPSAVASPADPAPPAPSGEDVLIPVQKGAVVTQAGVLLGLATAIRWANDLSSCREQVKVEQELAKEVVKIELQKNNDLWSLRMTELQGRHAVDLRSQKEKADLELKARNQQLLESLQQRRELEEKLARPAPFYMTPWFGAASATIFLAGGYLLLKK